VANTAGQVPKAIFVIVDGIPADVLEIVATPNLDAISAVGGYTRAYVGGTIDTPSESPTVSAVGYMSLLTGTWANKHNVWNNYILKPDYDYWDIFRLAKVHDESLETAIFSTWTDNRTKLIGDGLERAGGNKLDYYFDGFEKDTERFPHDSAKNYLQQIDDLVATEAARYIRENGPALSWVYLEHTDAIGHQYGDSPEMTQAIELMDNRIGLLWAAVSSRQIEHGEDWLLIVTTDHGRDLRTGKNHGGQSERERTIWIVTNHDELKESFYRSPGIVDIMPSIATHINLAIPPHIAKTLDGQSFIK
tara:strand:+ start:289 stop:1203 length:915 start_codon:yes stop_codon:yes gene_type:complete